MKTFFNWSSGKDSALALYKLQQDPLIRVSKLLTTINKHYQRVSMHGLRVELLERQAEAIGIPLETVALSKTTSMKEYKNQMNDSLKQLKKIGYQQGVFGDIFLEDLKQYRVKQFKEIGLKVLFPLWKQNTTKLLKDFLSHGFKAIVVCVDGEKLDASFAGQLLDESFIESLPKGVDPCGENGEFHTFCFDGPIFDSPIPFEVGEKVFRNYPENGTLKKGFWFQELIPI